MNEDNNVRSMFELLRSVLFQSMSAGIIEKVDEYGLTLMQRNILLYIGRNGGCNPRDINKEFSIVTPATFRIIRSLKRKRLITKRRIQQDARFWLLKVSTKGEEIIKYLDKIPIERLDKMVSEMSDRERKTFKEGFQIYFEGLKRITQAQS